MQVEIQLFTKLLLVMLPTSLHHSSSNSNPADHESGLHESQYTSSAHELAKLSSLFSAFRKCFKLQIGTVPKCFMLPIEYYW